MPDKQIIAFLFAISMLGVVLGSKPFKEGFYNGNIDISISEDEQMIGLEARYPKSKSNQVHAYIREQLHLSDLANLRAIEIKQYTSSDRFLSVYIKSRDGFLKVIMEKDRNTDSAYSQLRQAVKGIQKVLAE